jgi:HAD superfamily hydrolase (TIGR01509 family)
MTLKKHALSQKDPHLFEAIIFDHDGTLIDTESPDYEACRLMCREHGVDLPVEFWASKIVGYMDGYTALYHDLLAPLNNGFTEELMWQRLRQLWPIALEKTQLMPGVPRLLTDLQASGYPLGVATASDRAWVTHWLDKFNLRSYFQSISTKDDIRNNKPAPDVYIHAAQQLNVSPRRCLVFEDSMAGMLAAKAAGMTVVAVPSHVTHSLNFAQAHQVVNSLENVTVAWIEALAEKI